jgi:hypothetical protein
VDKAPPAKTGATAPKPKFCDVKELKITLFDGQEGDFHSGPKGGDAFTATDPRLRHKPAMDAPPHLREQLKHYDLVLELMATEKTRVHGQVTAPDDPLEKASKSGAGHASGRRTISPSTFHATANWKEMECGQAHHRNLLMFGPDGLKDQSPAGKRLDQQLWSGKMYRDLSDPIGIVKELWDHKRTPTQYVLEAQSCGKPSSGAKTDDLNALIIAHPVDQFGVVLQFNPFKLSFGWSPAKSNGKHSAEVEKLKAEAAAIKLPTKRNRLQSKKAFKAEKKALTAQQQKLVMQANEAAKTQKTVANVLGEAMNMQRDEEAALFDFGFIFNDVLYTRDELVGYKNNLFAALDTIKSVHKMVDKVLDLFTCLQKCAPAVVQPQVAFEIGLLQGELVVSTRYRKHLEGARFKSVARQLLMEGEFVIANGSGTIALVIGKSFFGSELTATGSITIEAKFWTESKCHFNEEEMDPRKFRKMVDWIKSQLLEYFQIKVLLGFCGRVEGRAVAMSYELGTGGGAVRGSVTFDSWTWNPRFGCTANVPSVVLELYFTSDLANKAKTKSFVLTEAYTKDLP